MTDPYKTARQGRKEAIMEKLDGWLEEILRWDLEYTGAVQVNFSQGYAVNAEAKKRLK